MGAESIARANVGKVWPDADRCSIAAKNIEETLASWNKGEPEDKEVSLGPHLAEFVIHDPKFLTHKTVYAASGYAH